MTTKNHTNMQSNKHTTQKTASKPSNHETDPKSHLSIYYDGLAQNLSSPSNSIQKPGEIKISYPIKGEEDGIIFAENLLSPEECANLIQATEEVGYIGVSGFDKKVRSNTRCRTVDSDMSAMILTRLSEHLPKTIIIDELRWNLSGFLDNWRYIKYNKGEHFAPHYDGSKKFDSYGMSIFTVNIYLNDGFAGGGTRFYMDSEENARENDFDAAGKVTHIVSPKQGSALIFNHCNKGYLHDGEHLIPTEDVPAKYLMRADLVYQIDENDLPMLKEKEKNGECRYWSLEAADEGTVVNYVGRTWKCACVSHEVTVTLH